MSASLSQWWRDVVISWHVCHVVQLLPSEAQHGYLLKLTELLNIDNSRNWRFREELARCVDFSDNYYLM